MARRPILIGVIVVVAATAQVALRMSRNNSRNNSTEINDLKKALAENPADQTVTSASMKCSMKIPGGMTSTMVLDPELPFQYQDEVKIRYLIGNCEPIADVKAALAYGEAKNRSVKQIYLDYTMELLKEGDTEISDMREIETIVADGKEGIILQADASNTEAILPLTYWIACFETDDTVYKFIYWTMKSRKDKERLNAIKIFKSIQFND